MKTYPSYEEANDRQLDLLAEDIDALVEYVPTGFDQVYCGSNPIYALMVEDERIADAVEKIRLIADETHRCLFRCPKCESDDVKELPLDEGFGTGPFSLVLSFGLIAMGRMILLRLRGRRYECRSCGSTYRKSP